MFIARKIYHMAATVMTKVTARTTSLMIVLFLSLTPTNSVSTEIILMNQNLPVFDCARITPRYTVMNCLGIDNIAAIENTKMPIPQVEKTAVVTKE